MIESLFRQLPSPESNTVDGVLQPALNIIREMPYNPHNSAANLTLGQMLKSFIDKQSGSCTPKHYFLGLYLESKGLNVKYLDYLFDWHKQKINFPEDLRSLVKGLPQQHHLALMVSSDLLKKPKLIDATWDSALDKLGFPINKIDVNMENCQLAVFTETKPKIFNSAVERWQAQQLRRQNMPDWDRVREFYERFGRWLNSERIIS